MSLTARPDTHSLTGPELRPRSHSRAALHPLAWWVWAAGLAVVTTRSAHPLISILIISVLVLVVVTCRIESPWGRLFPLYLALGATIVCVRIFFYVVVGIKSGHDTILDLPRIPLPSWAGGIELLGPVTIIGLGTAFSAGLALAALILCFGAAISLTDPRNALRALPRSLHLIGTAAVVAVALSPQLVESWQRVRCAQRLRGTPSRGGRAVVATAIPVLEDALDRSLFLAASMDSRGYASTHGAQGKGAGAAMLTSLLAAALGIYALLDGSIPSWAGPALLSTAALTAVLGTLLASRSMRRSRYRPDIWSLRATLVAASGVAAGVIAALSGPETATVAPILLVSCALGTVPVVTAVMPR